ncbi:MAG: hypothetical protein C4527_25240 [Candidatus Omnitrophota bacterium]|nr:MAG: hypothetical protein C4527_25240 [Candidatus Omnitrophota bacterium]
MLDRSIDSQMEKNVNIQLLVLGFLQLLAARFPLPIWAKSKCWLRTYTSETPSEFVTRTAFTKLRCTPLSRQILSFFTCRAPDFFSRAFAIGIDYVFSNRLEGI